MAVLDISNKPAEVAIVVVISVAQLFCELQRDWQRKETVPAFMNLFMETGGTAGLQFSYDKAE